MTDLELTRDMFARRQIDFLVAGEPNQHSDYHATYPAPENGTRLIVEGGYSGFFTVLSFADDGALLDVEAYE